MLTGGRDPRGTAGKRSGAESRDTSARRGFWIGTKGPRTAAVGCCHPIAGAAFNKLPVQKGCWLQSSPCLRADGRHRGASGACQPIQNPDYAERSRLSPSGENASEKDGVRRATGRERAGSFDNIACVGCIACSAASSSARPCRTCLLHRVLWATPFSLAHRSA